MAVHLSIAISSIYVYFRTKFCSFCAYFCTQRLLSCNWAADRDTFGLISPLVSLLLTDCVRQLSDGIPPCRRNVRCVLPSTGNWYRERKGTNTPDQEGGNLPFLDNSRGYLWLGPTSAFRISYGVMRLQDCSINPPYTDLPSSKTSVGMPAPLIKSF